jgi:hypothetical protein
MVVVFEHIPPSPVLIAVTQPTLRAVDDVCVRT